MVAGYVLAQQDLAALLMQQGTNGGPEPQADPTSAVAALVIDFCSSAAGAGVCSTQAVCPPCPSNALVSGGDPTYLPTYLPTYVLHSL